MSERGNTTHGPRLDDEMKQETEGMVRGNGPNRAEAARETEPYAADDTDDVESDAQVSDDEEVNP